MSIVARLAPLYGIVSVLLWGASWTAGKFAYEQLNGFEIILVRMGLSALCFLPILVYDVYKNGLPNKRDFMLVVVVGLSAYVITLLFQIFGLKYIDASVASIAVSLEGTFTMFVAYLFLKQKPVKSNYWVALISLIGLLIVIGIPEQAQVLGVFLILMANFFAGVSIVANKPLFENMSILGMTAWTIIIGFVLLLPGMAYFGVPNPAQYTTQTWNSLFVLSFGSTVIAYILYTACLKYLSATRTAQFIVIEPVFGVMLAVILLNEPLTFNIVLGTGLVVFAILINSIIDDGN